jgi:hypothetical protein
MDFAPASGIASDRPPEEVQMHARVVKFEGAEPDAVRSASAEIKERSEDGPPEGVPAVGLMMFIAPDDGRAMAISLFDSEEDMRTGDETLNKMDPPGDGMGRRTGVEMYEVAIDRRL